MLPPPLFFLSPSDFYLTEMRFHSFLLCTFTGRRDVVYLSVKPKWGHSRNVAALAQKPIKGWWGGVAKPKLWGCRGNLLMQQASHRNRLISARIKTKQRIKLETEFGSTIDSNYEYER